MMDNHDGSAHSASVQRSERRLDECPVIGWREYVDAPEWGVLGILAKIDTGARTSAIDVAGIEEIGRERVRFHVMLSRNHRHRRVAIEAKIRRRTRVRSSLGHVESRLIVATQVRIGPVSKKVELGLVCRKSMRCRVLLGRTALAKDFLVDAGRAYLLGRKHAAKSGSKRRMSSIAVKKGGRG